MASLDDVDIQTMLQLEVDLTDTSLDGFLNFIREHYGLANIAYLCPTFRGRSIENPFSLMTYSEAWIQHYRGQNYTFIDPVVNLGARSLVPLDWARLPREDRKVYRMFGEAQEMGVGRQGLTIPVRGPVNGLWALFNISCDDSDSKWSARRFELIKDLVHIAHYVHQRAYQLHVEDAPLDLDVITKREIEALEWSAEGKTLADIAILMRISVETVKSHLDSARFKLQAINRVHAVTKAIRAGLIR
jgi:DNA-binding CsgD family transcriptional regulator